MAVDRFEIFDDLELRPTEESRAQMAEFGVGALDAQDRCYGVLAEGLGAAARARRAERLAAATLQAEYLALVDNQA